MVGGNYLACPLGVCFGGLALLYNFVPICGYSSCFFFFFFESRWAGYVPTISEAGTDSPNAEVIRFATSMVGMATFYAFLGSVWYIECCLRLPMLLKILRRFGLAVSVIGTTGLGCFSLATDHSWHFFFASRAFIAIVTIELIDLIIIFRKSSPLANANRVMSMVAQAVSLSLFAICSAITTPREHNTVAALNELVLIGSMGWFYATFYNALRGIDLWIVMEN
jgi:hypothetical protein